MRSYPDTSIGDKEDATMLACYVLFIKRPEQLKVLAAITSLVLPTYSAS